ncbi:MAG: hypothetical protein D6819_04345 [Gammaproteobacteria bacterium]|nr:MAG: hypothetical protein D6819_04345 [Gammaproteobacteria bacterium]
MFLWLGLIALPHQGAAVEVAPRITDREIIEALSELKAGQKALNKRIDDLRAEMKAGQETLNKRIDDLRAEMKAGQETLNKRIDDLRAEMKAGQKALNKRIDDLRAETKAQIQSLRSEMQSQIQSLRSEMKAGQEALNKRIDNLWTLTMVLLAGIMGLIGFVVWDRKTALRPLEQRLIRLEHAIYEEIELQREAREVVQRMLKALRLLADEDERVARALKQCSLL